MFMMEQLGEQKHGEDKSQEIVTSISGVITNRADISILDGFCTVIGCTENVKLFYRVPGGVYEFKLHKTEGKKDVAGMASIGKQSGEVGQHLIQEFHVRFLNSKLGSSSFDMGEARVASEDAFYIDISFDDSATFEETTVPDKLVEEEDGCEVDNDANLESTNAGRLNNSDYHSSKDEDDVIFRNCVAQSNRELESVKERGQIAVVAKKEGRGSKTTKPASAQASKEENSDVKATSDADFNLYDGHRIPVQVELYTMNSGELDSNREGSNADSSRKRSQDMSSLGRNMTWKTKTSMLGCCFQESYKLLWSEMGQRFSLVQEWY